jgi:hypothetical protein
MTKIAIAKIIPRLGNARPGNGTGMLLPKAVVAAAVTGGRIGIIESSAGGGGYS